MVSAPALQQPRIGDRIGGKYQLVRLVGIGGMGSVFEAEHRVTGRRVALKVLHRALAQRKGFADRFLREAKSASSVAHPGIVDVLDAGIDADGTLYLALELLQGEDLGAALSRNVVDVRMLLRVTLELLFALEAAHAQGIVHRDLKPENAFLARMPDGSGRVKLLDFGIAKQFGPDAGALTSTGAVLGTPCYMSPEQARGGRDVDGRSDLWSLGAVVYDALTGRPPPDGIGYNEIIASILTDVIPPLGTLRPDLPADLAALVDKALVRDREQRWQSAAEMRAALEAFLASRPTPDPLSKEMCLSRVRRSTTLEDGAEPIGAAEPTPLLGPTPAPAGLRRAPPRWAIGLAAAVVLVTVVALAAHALRSAATPDVQTVPLAQRAATPPSPRPPLQVLPPSTPTQQPGTPPPGSTVPPPDSADTQPAGSPAQHHPRTPAHRPTDPIRTYYHPH